MDHFKKKLSEAISMNDKVRIEKRINVACGIITKKGENNEDLFLLIQRAKNDNFPLMWETARGKCDKGKNEDLIHCLKREVKEETGLDIYPIKYIDNFIYLADNGSRLSIQHNYLCKLKNENQKVKLSKEHDSYKWITSLGIAEL
jgi:8-oxo-dGTP pyrophosphatase MutT (NUDIX family)